MAIRTGRAVEIVVVISVLSSAACGGGGSHPDPRPLRALTFTVDHPAESAFRPVDVRLSGLKPGEQVTVTSSADDYRGTVWEGKGTYTADASGGVDIAKDTSSAGTYTGVDAMGLIWSMNPPDGTPDAGFGPADQTSFDVVLKAAASGAAGSTTLIRQWTAPGETHQQLILARDKVIGTLYYPAPSTKPRPGVLVFGGSEGGEQLDHVASVLASEGYPALSIGYFRLPGLSATLSDIPLEYFEQAATDLSNQPGVDRDHILVMGSSRGSEAALLSAQNFPQIIHGVIVYSPSAITVGSYPESFTPAWTLHGLPVPTGEVIPVDHIAGPLLAFAGRDDALWSSATWAPQISDELDAAHSVFPHKATVFPDAGHAIAGNVGLPQFTTEADPSTGQHLEFGGSRQADAAAQQAAWSDVLGLLKSLSG